MYEHKTKVRYTESGANGEMLLGAVVDCFQNVFHFEAEDASLDTQNLKKMNLGWFIYFWQIDIDLSGHLCMRIGAVQKDGISILSPPVTI